MAEPSQQEVLDLIAGMLISRRSAVALTGAGISVPSGIPDFRSPGGLWTRYDPSEYGTIGAFVANPVKVWRRLAELEELVAQAKPNPAHQALAELERLGVLYGIITQNVDNLHQEAGSACVVEFHGSCRRLRCLGCRRRYSAAERAALSTPPRCADCGRVLKPDMVMFEEPVERDVIAAAMQLIRTCGILLIIGTSAVVAPASAIPQLAAAGGALLIEVNTGVTALSAACDFAIQGDAADFLPTLARRVRELAAARGF